MKNENCQIFGNDPTLGEPPLNVNCFVSHSCNLNESVGYQIYDHEEKMSYDQTES